MEKKITALWESSTVGSRILAAAILALILVSAGAVSMLARRAGLAPLFTDLNSTDAAKVIGKLKEAKIPYRLGEGGRTIEVSAAQVHELRLSLAASGVPSRGTIGFELFDSVQFGLSGFGEKVQYRRALEGELSRTISHIDGVGTSRVHISLPNASPYMQEKPSAKASVVLYRDTAAPLDRAQIGGIAHLVASAVEGLSHQDVSIIEENGRLLSGGGEEGGIEDLKRAAELRFQRKIETLLQRIYGSGSVTARVQVKLDAQRIDSVIETYTTGAEGGILRSVQEITETGSEEGFASKGVPGVESLGKAAGPGGAGGKWANNRTQRTVNYEVNKRVEHLLKLPGAIQKISAAVLISTTSFPAAEKVRVTTMISAALGIDLTRGDKIIIEAREFVKLASDIDGLAADAKLQKLLIIDRGIKYGGIAIAGVMIFLLGWQMLKRLQFIEVREIPVPAPAGAAARNGASARAALPIPSVGELKKRVTSLAESHPESFQRTIGAWSADAGGGGKEEKKAGGDRKEAGEARQEVSA